MIKPKRPSVFITGASGFIGANLAHHYAQKGRQVFLFLRKGSQNDWRIRPLADLPQVTRVTGDILDPESLNCLKNIRPDCIIHTAAYGGYGPQQKDTAQVHKINYAGTANLLNKIKDLSFKSFILTGSSSEYGIRQHPMKETDTPDPVGVYGDSKTKATALARETARQTGQKIFIVRPFSIYGYYEEPFRLIPDVVLSYLNKQKLKLRTPEAKRDYLFIEDVFALFDALINKQDVLAPGEIFNMGSGNESSVMDIVRAFKTLFNHEFQIELEEGVAREGDRFEKWQADISHAKALLDWQPQHDLNTGIEKTVAWFKQNLHLYPKAS